MPSSERNLRSPALGPRRPHKITAARGRNLSKSPTSAGSTVGVSGLVLQGVSGRMHGIRQQDLRKSLTLTRFVYLLFWDCVGLGFEHSELNPDDSDLPGQSIKILSSRSSLTEGGRQAVPKLFRGGAGSWTSPQVLDNIGQFTADVSAYLTHKVAVSTK